MESLLTPANITFGLGLLGVMFSIYHYFRNPQISNEKKDALLRQQVQWSSEGTERRFTEMQKNIHESFNLAQNHIHTVDTKVDKLVETVGQLSNEVTKLGTIIEERVPRK